MFTGVQGTAAVENVLLVSVVSQLLLSVQFQFCKLLLHLFSLAPPPSSKPTLIGGAAPQPPPLVSTGNSQFTLLKKSPPGSWYLPLTLRYSVLGCTKDLL